MTDFARRDFLLTGAGISAAWTSARGGERTSQPEPDRFEAVAGFELAEVVKSHPLALVPLGSLEYHGPHNPLGTDSIIVFWRCRTSGGPHSFLALSYRDSYALPGAHCTLPGDAIDAAGGYDDVLRGPPARRSECGIHQDFRFERA